MAINKVVNKSTKTHDAMKKVLCYVMRDDKVKEGYMHISGPFPYDAITPETIYEAWVTEKKLWGKDNGRLYAHNVISFHKDEHITPEDVLLIGRNFVEKFFPDHQNIIAVHQDKGHLHCHIVTNTVSFIDGKKLHQNKHELEQQKQYTNHLCQQYGFTVTRKGYHFDGNQFEKGDVICWKKDKYNLLKNDIQKSFIARCAVTIMETIPNTITKDDFFYMMRTGDDKAGIVFNGQFISDPYPGDDWAGSTKRRMYVDMICMNPVKIGDKPIISLKKLQTAIPELDWAKGHSGTLLSDEINSKLDMLWDEE